jgi:LAT3 family solute carrier family 43 protein 3
MNYRFSIKSLKATPEHTGYLLFGVCFLCAGGAGVLVSNMPIGNLFPKVRAIVITVINGLFGSSSIVFVVFKKAYESGTTWKAIFLWYTLATLFCFFRTFLLMPKGIIPFVIPEDFQIGLSSYKRDPIEEKVSGITVYKLKIIIANFR